MTVLSVMRRVNRVVNARPAPLLADELLLGRRLVVHARWRFGVAAAIVLAAFVGRDVLGLAAISVPALSIIAGAILLYNLLLWAFIGPVGDHEHNVRMFPRRLWIVRASIVLDFLALTAALWYVGGVRSPFLAFYLFHIVLSSILVSRRWAFLSAGLAAALLTGLMFADYLRILPPPIPVGAIPGEGPLGATSLATLAVVYLSLLVLIVVSQTRAADDLRNAERLAADRAAQAEKLSRMRKDFLHVALHDVNSPMATAGLLLRNLREGLCGPLLPAQDEQIQRALHRLESMEELIHDLRVLSDVETSDLKSHAAAIELSELVDGLVEEHQDAALAKRVTLIAEPAQSRAQISGVPRLVREAVANYITNAIKYTPEGGTIRVRVRPGTEMHRVEVADTGLGISRADQERLFEEFSRVGRDRPELRRIKGTGLGLSIVRRIVEAHDGSVGVSSEPTKGSVFWLEFPANV